VSACHVNCVSSSCTPSSLEGGGKLGRRTAAGASTTIERHDAERGNVRCGRAPEENGRTGEGHLQSHFLARVRGWESGLGGSRVRGGKAVVDGFAGGGATGQRKLRAWLGGWEMAVGDGRLIEGDVSTGAI
jgi:hypothetical protein